MDASAEDVVSIDERRRIRAEAFKEAEAQCQIAENNKRLRSTQAFQQPLPVAGRLYLEMKAKQKEKEERLVKNLYIVIGAACLALAAAIALRELGYF